MTKATAARLCRLYEKVVGYDPALEGWTLAEVLDCLRWMRTALCLCNGDPTAYTGPTLSKAQLVALI
jgi:hypothetical protein